MSASSFSIVKNGWVNIVLRLGFLASFIIGLLTLAFSAYQYFDQRGTALTQARANQTVQIKSQIRKDIEQLIKFPSDKSLTLAGVQALLTDLDELLKSEKDVLQATPESIQSERRAISKNLYSLVYLDCDFSNRRDTNFSIVVLESWDDYRAYLQTPKDGPDLTWDMILQYNDALTALRDKAPEFISQIKYNKAASQYEYSDSTQDYTLREFEDLVRAFHKHLDILNQQTPDGMEQRKSLIKFFQAATCNKDYAQSRFGFSVDPASDSQMFAACL